MGVISSLLLLVWGQFSNGATIHDPDLFRFSQSLLGASSGLARVIVLVAPPQNYNPPKPQRYNRAQVVSYFKEASRQSLLPLFSEIQNNQIQGVRILRSYWINAAFVADVTPSGLRAISQHPSVLKIYRNHQYKRDPTRSRGAGKPAKAPSIFNSFGIGDDSASSRYNFSSLGLDKLFKEKPQIIGTGAVIGVVDSGVDESHMALRGKILSFYNVSAHSMGPPMDQESHGTHVSGTIVGGDRKENWIGVAPGAKLIVAGMLADYDAVLEGMQWFLDAEKNSKLGVPIKAINCSWNTTDAPDQELFYRAIAAWEAAGILPIFSVGNAGPRPSSISPPHEHPGAFGVAAYGADGRVADFSGRGPGIFHGKVIQKPDITAPGVEINSTILNGQYEKRDGTSMAAPHVSGAVALLLQINPNLNPAQIKQILLQTTTLPPGGVRGQWNPNWGYGYLNAYNAVMGLLKLGTNSSSHGLRLGWNIKSPFDMESQMLSAAKLGPPGEAYDLQP